MVRLSDRIIRLALDGRHRLKGGNAPCGLRENDDRRSTSIALTALHYLKG
jgi:hypothetical protein